MDLFRVSFSLNIKNFWEVSISQNIRKYRESFNIRTLIKSSISRNIRNFFRGRFFLFFKLGLKSGKKGIYPVHEDVQQQLIATGAKLMRYDNHNRQFLQNRLLESNQKNLFEKLEGGRAKVFDPEPEDSRIF